MAPRGFFLDKAMKNPSRFCGPCFLSIVFLFVGQPLMAVIDNTVAAANPANNTVDLRVYKKWIGASGNETRVEIYLTCENGAEYGPRYINRDRPDDWKITGVPEKGIFCSVHEVGQETFVADDQDCLNLLVLPGQDVECTMVNTKVVKRIDMLNRYGLGLMIIVMLLAGLLSANKLGSH